MSVSGSTTYQLFATHGEPGEYELLGDVAPLRDSASFGGRSVLWTGGDAWSVSDNPPALTHLGFIDSDLFPIWNELSEGIAGIYFRNNTLPSSAAAASVKACLPACCAGASQGSGSAPAADGRSGSSCCISAMASSAAATTGRWPSGPASSFWR